MGEFTRKAYFELWRDGVPVVASGRNSNRHITLVEAGEHAEQHAVEVGSAGVYEIRVGQEVYYTVKINQIILDYTVDPPSTPAQAELSLGSSFYSGDENTQINFSINRGADTTERVSVDWAIINANATPSSGTVIFEISDTQKLVSVTAGEVGPSETGSLQLSNPQNLSGGSTPALVSPSTATFTINDTDASAFVRFYDNMSQVYVSPNGSGDQSGSDINNTLSFFNAARNSPDNTCLNLVPALYQMDQLFGVQFNVANPGAGPHITQTKVIRPVPGSPEESVILDSGGTMIWSNNFDHWIFDGEDSILRMQGGGTMFVSSGTFDGVSTGIRFYNYRYYGATDAGDNGGGIRAEGNGGVEMYEFENFEMIWSHPNPNSNQAALFIRRNSDTKIRHGRVVGAGTSFYFKHAPDTILGINNYATRIEYFITGNSVSSRNYVDHSERTHYYNCILPPNFNDAGGRTASNFYRFNECTINGQLYWPADQQNDDIELGGWQHTWRFSVVAGLRYNNATSPNMDYNAYEAGNFLNYNGATYDLAGARTLLGGDANSIQETLQFAGSDQGTPSDWLLTGGGAQGGHPLGFDLGANTSLVGMLDVGLWQPAIMERFLVSPLNQDSKHLFIDTTTFNVGTHIRHGFGCYETTWNPGIRAAGDSQGAIRHNFDPTDEVTLYFQWWVSANFGVTGPNPDWLHWIHFKTTLAGSQFEAPAAAGAYTVNFEPYQVSGSVGPGNPGYWFVDMRRNGTIDRTYRNSDAQNLTDDADINVYDANLCHVRIRMRMNTPGSANGLLQVDVNNRPTIMRNDFEPLINTAAQFNQVIIAPYISTDMTNSGTQRARMSDFDVWRDWR